ncbi:MULTISPECIES: hypothetical protein [unclassified Streptomyces]|uniref:hypothetical protein n=1 Tax=unclassified Streptomyces TaxID=2593676 RepID=UPI00081D8D87|nr:MULTISPECIES: hypothetical protein [unclassified Streptomyces]MYZ35848.1 hypothetical protein [Streptomyces sp. SID4917]SCF78824.1 hypothetical protein GA0115259_102553 [Streptomyces sp. MnatMP-M17]
MPTTPPHPTEPEADERRVQHLLRMRIDGPTAHQPAAAQTVPPRTTQAPAAAPVRDWWDDLYADEPEPETDGPVRGGGRLPDWRKPKPVLPAPAEDEPEEPEEPAAEENPTPDVEQDTEPPAKPAPAAPGWLQPEPGYYPPLPPVLPTVRRAPAALSPKTRAGLYNAAAAGAGWSLGLYDLFARAIANCGATTSIGGALTLGAGSCLVIAHLWDRRTRHWWIGLAWVARIPLATAITALALYAPASTI